MEQKGKMICIGGLWKNQGRNGEFLAGNFGRARIMVFKNREKKLSKDSDYLIYIVEDSKKRDNPNQTTLEMDGNK